jgi:hypothetical protein
MRQTSFTLVLRWRWSWARSSILARGCDHQLIFHQFCLQADTPLAASPLPAERCRKPLKAQTLNASHRGVRCPSRSSQVRVMSRRSESSRETQSASRFRVTRTCCRHRYAELERIAQRRLQAFNPAQHLAGHLGGDSLSQTRKRPFHWSHVRRRPSQISSSSRD